MKKNCGQSGMKTIVREKLKKSNSVHWAVSSNSGRGLFGKLLIKAF